MANRHPLQELVVDTFVPNDIAFAGSGCEGVRLPSDDEDATGDNSELNSIVVCTGANACGKVGTGAAALLPVIDDLPPSNNRACISSRYVNAVIVFFSCSSDTLPFAGSFDTLHGTGMFSLYVVF